MHISGSATTKNAPTTENEYIDIPFNWPPGVTEAQLSSTADPVFTLNGNVLSAAAFTYTIEDGPVVRVENVASDADWPPNSTVTFQIDVIPDYTDNPNQFGPYEWMELLQAQAAQIADLEARVTALENP